MSMSLQHPTQVASSNSAAGLFRGAVVPGKAYLNRDQAITLIRQLANDAGFYGRFQASPAAGLAELGLPKEFALCCQGITLPTVEVLRHTEASLASDISAFTSQTVIGLAAK